ncbi:MAG: hypothetical protein IAE91_08950 [Ignavibacteriaceae bacterium]|nr:hypothetical protein [Ignavibacteriaceae bacterium]
MGIIELKEYQKQFQTDFLNSPSGLFLLGAYPSSGKTLAICDLIAKNTGVFKRVVYFTGRNEIFTVQRILDGYDLPVLVFAAGIQKLREFESSLIEKLQKLPENLILILPGEIMNVPAGVVSFKFEWDLAVFDDITINHESLTFFENYKVKFNRSLFAFDSASNTGFDKVTSNFFKNVPFKNVPVIEWKPEVVYTENKLVASINSKIVKFERSEEEIEVIGELRKLLSTIFYSEEDREKLIYTLCSATYYKINGLLFDGKIEFSDKTILPLILKLDELTSDAKFDSLLKILKTFKENFAPVIYVNSDEVVTYLEVLFDEQDFNVTGITSSSEEKNVSNDSIVIISDGSFGQFRYSGRDIIHYELPEESKTFYRRIPPQGFVSRGMTNYFFEDNTGSIPFESELISRYTNDK